MARKVLHSIRPIDYKGRVVIPIKLRKAKKYMIFTAGDKIILEGCK